MKFKNIQQLIAKKVFVYEKIDPQEEYGLNDLSPESWDHLIDKIIYEKSVYDKFVRYILHYF